MKQETKHARRMRELAAQTDTREGKWEVSFIFDGKRYVKTHKLSQSEIKHMKDLCVEFGDEAAQQVIWRAAIKGVGTVSENLMARAGLDFVKKYYKIPVGEAKVVPVPTYDTLAALEGYVESVKPLSDDQAFSLEAAAQLAEQQMKDKL